MSERAPRPTRPTRAEYPHLVPLATRWMDNDIYGHVNNVTYYSYFDTVANAFMIEHGLDIQNGDIIGVIAESQCHYHREIAFPDQLEIGLRVGRLGTSAVTWELAIFREDDPEAAAHGHFVHVLVGRESRRPVPIPDRLRTAMASILGSAVTGE